MAAAVLPIAILDTQAGLKGLSGAAWAEVAESMRSDGFFFDVELLARVKAAGLNVAETPIIVRYQDPTTVRMLVHGWSMLIDSLRLRADLSRKAPTGRGRRCTGCSISQERRMTAGPVPAHGHSCSPARWLEVRV